MGEVAWSFSFGSGWSCRFREAAGRAVGWFAPSGAVRRVGRKLGGWDLEAGGGLPQKRLFLGDMAGNPRGLSADESAKRALK